MLLTMCVFYINVIGVQFVRVCVCVVWLLAYTVLLY